MPPPSKRRRHDPSTSAGVSTGTALAGTDGSDATASAATGARPVHTDTGAPPTTGSAVCCQGPPRWYSHPPNGTLELEQLQLIARARLESLFRASSRFPATYPWAADASTLAHLHPRIDTDAVGHYFLRLSLCQDTQSAMWLANAEVRDLEKRFLCRTCGDFRVAAAEDFLRSSHGLLPLQFYVPRRWDQFGSPVDPVKREWERVLPKNWPEDERFREMASVICGAKQPPAQGDPLCDLHVRVPFEGCTELVRRRDPAVVLAQGYLYLPRSRWRLFVLATYRRCLVQEMEVAHRVRPLVLYHDGDRMVPLFTTILADFAALHAVYSGRGGLAVAAVDVPKLQVSELNSMATLMPPCMRRFHHTFTTTHHLKYEGRLLYVLFLKGAGLTLKDQEVLWETEFLKTMTKPQYDKKRYNYSIRHLYGQEGSRINKTPYTCSKISEDFRARCPFGSLESARAELEAAGVVGDLKDTVVDAVAAQRPTAACGMCFQHRCSGTGSGSSNPLPQGFASPNDYFEAARAVFYAQATPMLASVNEGASV